MWAPLCATKALRGTSLPGRDGDGPRARGPLVIGSGVGPLDSASVSGTNLPSKECIQRMLFNSFGFILLFLPLVLGVAGFLRGRLLLAWVAAVSFVFYSFAGHVWFLVPMLFTTLLDFVVAQRMARATSKQQRRLLLSVSLVGNLGLLAHFKYSGLITHSLQAICAALIGANVAPQWIHVFDVLLPAGISFYTFQTLSYMLDVYRGVCPPERSLLKFAGFVSFFPHLVAGPLTRHDELIPQLDRIARRGIQPMWRAGIFLFAIGLCKKVLVADRVAQIIDPMLDEGQRLGLLGGWIAMLGYSVQIYFDFSGYSDMAIGLGRLFGIELPQNFDSPYQATSPAEFWRRWHMTLSRWLRDYLYISLGGNRCSRARRHFNLIATMVLGGLWHGASWTFAAWGLFHGLVLVVYHAIEPRWDRMSATIRRGLTFVLVCFGWVFFRARTFEQAGRWFGALVGLEGVHGAGSLSRLSGGAAIIACALVVANVVPNASTSSSLPAIGPWRQIALGLGTGLALVFMSYSSKFLYFQF